MALYCIYLVTPPDFPWEEDDPEYWTFPNAVQKELVRRQPADQFAVQYQFGEDAEPEAEPHVYGDTTDGARQVTSLLNEVLAGLAIKH